MNVFKLISFSLVSALMGCSTLPMKKQIAEEALFYGAGVNLGHSRGQCNLIQSRCDRNGYSQWQSDDGATNCSCKED